MTHEQYFQIKMALRMYDRKGKFPKCISDAVQMATFASMFRSYMEHEEREVDSPVVANALEYYGIPLATSGDSWRLMYVK